MSIYATIPGIGNPNEGDDPTAGELLLYRGSHVLPSEDDPCGGHVALALIPSHTTRDGRDHGPDDTTPWPWLRLSLDDCGPDPTTLLNPAQARHVAGLLTGWADSTDPHPGSLGRVLADIAAERARQDARWGIEDPGDFERISILTEEVGEAAQAANQANFRSSPTRGDYHHLRTELVQVAATAAAHIQIIDTRDRAQVKTVTNQTAIRLAELAILKPGWLDGCGEAISTDTIALARRLADALPSDTRPLRIFPTEPGGVEIEWRDPHGTHSITVQPDGTLYLLSDDPDDPITRRAAAERTATALDGQREDVGTGRPITRAVGQDRSAGGEGA